MVFIHGVAPSQTITLSQVAKFKVIDYLQWNFLSNIQLFHMYDSHEYVQGFVTWKIQNYITKSIVVMSSENEPYTYHTVSVTPVLYSRLKWEYDKIFEKNNIIIIC